MARISTHTISVTYLRSAGLAHAVLTPPAAVTGAAKPRAFAAAKTAQLADVYLSGNIIAADGAKPSFSFEARLQNDWRLGSNRGAIGYVAEMVADQQANVDSDRIVVGATYRRVLAAQRNGLILHVQPVAGEFARQSAAHHHRSDDRPCRARPGAQHRDVEERRADGARRVRRSRGGE